MAFVKVVLAFGSLVCVMTIVSVKSIKEKKNAYFSRRSMKPIYACKDELYEERTDSPIKHTVHSTDSAPPTKSTVELHSD
jgi:type IV secretory pathway TraG/TraD family ATPase VirD4